MGVVVEGEEEEGGCMYLLLEPIALTLPHGLKANSMHSHSH